MSLIKNKNLSPKYATKMARVKMNQNQSSDITPTRVEKKIRISHMNSKGSNIPKYRYTYKEGNLFVLITRC